MKEKKRQEKLLQKKAEKLAAAEREKELLNKCTRLQHLAFFFTMIYFNQLI